MLKRHTIKEDTLECTCMQSFGQHQHIKLREVHGVVKRSFDVVSSGAASHLRGPLTPLHCEPWRACITDMRGPRADTWCDCWKCTRTFSTYMELQSRDYLQTLEQHNRNKHLTMLSAVRNALQGSFPSACLESCCNSTSKAF